MFPRSGGEKVYLEAVHKKTKVLATVVFAANAVLLASSAGGSVVFSSKLSPSQCRPMKATNYMFSFVVFLYWQALNPPNGPNVVWLLEVRACMRYYTNISVPK